MFHLKNAVREDNHPDKVDLGIGVYRNETGNYHELNVLKKAKEYLVTTNPHHSYDTTTGSPVYLGLAANVVFGKGSELLKAGKVGSAQTISGTGAVHMGAIFLKHSVPDLSQAVYVGTPAWGNYKPIFTFAGFDVRNYAYYDREKQVVDFDVVLKTVREAPKRSIFILQGCCHNPVAIDFSRQQWQILTKEIREHEHFPFFDIAYQGLGNGLEDDAFAVRHFAESGDLIVAQSFSKNFGLYGERVGAIHVVVSSAEVAANVKDRIRSLIRWEFSSPPAYGSRIVTRVLSEVNLEAEWRKELETIRLRLKRNREELHRLLNDVYRAPGDWSSLLRSTGLICLLPLNSDQTAALQKQHIYMVSNGRLNVSGLTDKNFDIVARAIDTIIRNPSKL